VIIIRAFFLFLVFTFNRQDDPFHMRTNRFKSFVVVMIAVFFTLALLASLGIFDNKSYTAVPHGNHTHYVPKDRDPSVPMHNFPQQPPPPGKKISPTGEIVPE
jgi:hypothetical protein